MKIVFKHIELVVAGFLSVIVGLIFCSTTEPKFFSSYTGFMWDMGYLFGGVVLQWVLGLAVAGAIYLFCCLKKRKSNFLEVWGLATLCASLLLLCFVLPRFLEGHNTGEVDINSSEYWEDATIIGRSDSSGNVIWSEEVKEPRD